MKRSSFGGKAARLARSFAMVLLAAVALLSAAAGEAQASRWGKSYFPDVELVTHEGKTVRFYDDLIKDKVFVVSFLYTTCRDFCPLAAARLSELQEKLGDAMGRDVFFYSISIDPETDTPERLKEYAKTFAAGPGWLFLTDELILYKGAEANFAQRMKIVVQVSDFLKRRNVPLVVVPVPDKSRVEAQHLCGLDRSASLGDRFTRMNAALSRVGVRTVDILSPLAALDGERYYRTDTHWNERGAKRSAESVAAAVQQATLAPAQQAEFRVKSEPAHERVGDLIRLAGLDQVPLPLRPKGDTEAATAIEQGAKGDVGILDDVAAPETVLLGTSYSRQANFAGFLGMALGAPIENMALDGGGLANAAMAYFDKPGFSDTPLRLVVWEIPERFLEEPVAASDAAWAESLAGRTHRK